MLLETATAAATAADKDQLAPTTRLAEAIQAYRAAAFTTCAVRAGGLAEAKLSNPDVVLFVQAQCLFYAGEYEPARRTFDRLGRKHPQSPHAPLALARQADCLWAQGRKRQAVALYARARAGRGSASRRLGPPGRVGLLARPVQAGSPALVGPAQAVPRTPLGRSVTPGPGRA